MLTGAGSREDTSIRTAMDALRRIVRVIREAARGAEKQAGISGAQVFVMHCLGASGPLTISELAAATMTHQSSVSVVVQRLVERGLVTRGVSDDDRRRREVELTAAGRRLLRRTPDAAQTRLIAGMNALPTTARRDLAAHLVALVHTMGADREPADMFFEDGRGSMGSQGARPRSAPRVAAPSAGVDGAVAGRRRQTSRQAGARRPRARRSPARP